MANRPGYKQGLKLEQLPKSTVIRLSSNHRQSVNLVANCMAKHNQQSVISRAASQNQFLAKRIDDSNQQQLRTWNDMEPRERRWMEALTKTEYSDSRDSGGLGFKVS